MSWVFWERGEWNMLGKLTKQILFICFLGSFFSCSLAAMDDEVTFSNGTEVTDNYVAQYFDAYDLKRVIFEACPNLIRPVIKKDAMAYLMFINCRTLTAPSLAIKDLGKLWIIGCNNFERNMLWNINNLGELMLASCNAPIISRIVNGDLPEKLTKLIITCSPDRVPFPAKAVVEWLRKFPKLQTFRIEHCEKGTLQRVQSLQVYGKAVASRLGEVEDIAFQRELA